MPSRPLSPFSCYNGGAMKDNIFYAYLARMKYINRWALMRNTNMENLEEHSYRVAVIAHALAVIGNTYFSGQYNGDKIAVAALFHDCSEIITGDMPTPVKYYNPEISDAYKRVEAVANNKLLSMLPEEMQPTYEPMLKESDPEVKRLVKAADRLSAYIKCIEESKVGNREFSKAADSVLKSIQDMHIPEADFFVDNFLPAYGLTLDEME